MLLSYKRSQASVVFRVKILDSSATDGSGLTGLAYDTASLIISTIADNEATATAYTVTGSTIETISTLGTYAAPTATKCRFKEVDSTNHPGVYEIQLADARFAVASAKSLIVSISGATDCAETDVLIPLVDLDPYVAMRGTDSALTDKTGFALTSAYDAAKTAATQTSVNAIATILTGITSLAAWLRGLFRKDAMDATAKTEINSGGGAFDETTDSNEAIRDRGDAAYLTATGFAVPGDEMDLVDAPNATAITAIQSGITPLNATETAQAVLDATAASYDTAGSIGEKINDAGAAVDPWSTAVPGAYASGTAGYNQGLIDEIKAKTDLIGTSGATISAPVVQNGTVELVYGSDYTTAQGRSLAWTETGYSGPSFTDSVTTLKIMRAQDYRTASGVGPVLTKTGSAVDVGGTATYTIELTAANIASLTDNNPPKGSPNYVYELQVLYTTGEVRVLDVGTMTIIRNVRA